jgi:hypothetical protein
MTFKKFVKRISEAKDQEEAWAKVFYGEDGIDLAYQAEKITWNDHQLLVAIIKKMA